MSTRGSFGRMFAQQFAALLLGSSYVLAANPPERPQLENFDHRKAAGVFSPAPAAMASLSVEVPGVRVDRDPVLGGAGFVGSSTGLLTAPVAAGTPVDPVKITSEFLDRHRGVFLHGADALAGAKTLRDYTTASNGVRTMVWQQQLDGVRVFEATLQSHVTAGGALVNLSSKLVPNPAAATKGSAAERAAHLAAPAISARQAVALAGQNLGEEMAESSVAESGAPEGAEKKQRFRSRALIDISAELCWLPIDAGDLRLCWEVIAVVKRRGEMYRVLIDAQTGEAHLRHSLTNYISNASYRVFTSDSPSPFSPGPATPTSTQPPLATRTLVTTPALNTTASPNGWIDDGVNETRGNNVDAHTDLTDDNVPDAPRPQGAPNRVFDFPLNLTQEPSAYRNAAVTQLFYLNNWIHDRLYALGFTEAAGNFQNNNFGRGGVGNDAVQADAQDGASLSPPNANNANFSTPPDGSPGRMQMYVFTDPTPDRDGSFDGEIVIHEYAHGLSNRLVGGGVGISQLQSGGMGEGWGDFYGIALLSEPGDDVNGNYAAGGYATYQLGEMTTNYYFGIRRYPYSTDLTKNPLTFKDIDPGQASSHAGIPISPIIGGPGDEVHNQGEVWCVTLWDARANLIAKHGFATGNQLILQLVTDGMKLGPANPNFLQARDAIIQADLVANGGANRLDLWAAFAKRGMGASASSPPSNTTSGVIESFDLPDDLSVTPNAGFTASGPVGGPFNANSTIFTLRNNGTAPLVWTAAVAQTWLSISATGGTLAPGATTTVTASLNAVSNNLPAAVYPNSVTFTNTVSGAVLPRPFALRVGQPDYFTELFDNSPNDTANQSFTFTPNGSSSFYLATREVVSSFPTSPTGGTALTQGDDTSVAVTLTGGMTAKLYGASYASFNVGSNGYITFGAAHTGYSPSFPDHFAYRRVAALFRDLNFTGQGTCTWRQLADRAAVTWQNVPVYNTTNSNNFQIELFFDGRIRITILGIAATDGLIGLSAGNGVPANFAESDFSAYPSPRMVTINLPAAASESAGTLTNQGTVTVSPAAAAALTVVLTSSDPAELTVPSSVTIPAGQTSATFSPTVLDDALLDGTQIVTITGSAATYTSGSRAINVTDNETAALAVTLPPSATEGVGTVTGTVSVSEAPAKAVVVSFSTSNAAEATATPTIIPAGQTTAPFTVNIVDDTRIDGTVSTTITPVVTNWTSTGAAISVADNEARTLALTLPTVTEGATATGTVSIPGTLTTPLTVSLSSAAPGRLAVASSTTINAGATSATFSISGPENALTDGTQSVNVTASAAAFTSATAPASVLDNDVHHFNVSTIASPQIANVPFAVTVTAVDINDVWITGHTTTLTFTAAGANGAVAVTPASAALTGGQWTGTRAIAGLDSNVVLTVRNTANRTGTSNAFNVGLGPLDHFNFNTIASPQTRSAPFAVTVTAKDAGDNTVTDYIGTAAFDCGLPTRTVGAGTTTWGHPLYTFYEDERTQVIYPAAEIGLAGRISALALYVTTPPGQTMNAWTIRLKHTALASYGATPAWESTGWTTAYQANQTITGTGWVNFVFPTPFQYNGTSALMIDFSFNNSTYTTEGISRYTTAAANRTIYAYSDSDHGDPLVWSGTGGSGSPTPTASTSVPNLRVQFERLLPVTPAATTAFTNGVWSGQVAIGQNGTGVSLGAANADGIRGESNTFNVTGSNLNVTPGGLNASGSFGGPHAPLTFVYTLTNAGTSLTTWTASESASWFALSSTGGGLTAGASTTVTAYLTEAAKMLEPGAYSAAITFTNNGTGAGTNLRTAALTVTLPAPLLLPEPAVTAGSENTLAWFAVAGSTWSEIQRATAADFSDAASSGWIAANEYTFTGLADATLYHYRVRVRRAPGNESLWSAVVSSQQAGGAPADADGDGLPDSWETAHGLDAFDVADGTGDADGDGLANLLELGAGLDPRTPDASRALTASIEPNPADGATYLVVRYRRLLAPGALKYALEVSINVTDWRTATAGEIEEPAPPTPNGDGRTETVTLRLKPPLGTPGHEARQVRLRVSVP